jgi:hypothetical protein
MQPGWTATSQRGISMQGASAAMSQVAVATLWLQRYETTLRNVNPVDGRLVHVNLLAATFQHFCPLLARLTPKIELPRNIKKLLGGATSDEVGVEGSNLDVRELPKRGEGPRSGLLWAFFEFEFAVMCIARLLEAIKKSSGILHNDSKVSFLAKIQAAQKDKALKVSLNDIAQGVFASTLLFHQQHFLSRAVARSLQAFITTSMGAKMRFTSISTFMGYFDFSVADEWRDFIRVSAAVCKRLRDDISVMIGEGQGTISNEDGIPAIYTESYVELERIVERSDQSTWWQN